MEIDTNKIEMIIIIVGLFVMISGATGYYIGNQEFDDDAALQRTEFYMRVYTDSFGRTMNCDDGITGIQCRKENEKYFREALNFVNVPTNLFNENLTVNEAIQAYDKYQGGSKFITKLVLRDICTR